MLSACLLGLATGGMLPVWGSVTARALGLISYSRTMGLMGAFLTLLVITGYTLIGRLYDANDSSQLAMLVLTGIAVVSALLLLPLRLRRE
jgi:DMSO/TMAO reductase YedYZ heme-binding membrane subunit